MASTFSQLWAPSRSIVIQPHLVIDFCLLGGGWGEGCGGEGEGCVWPESSAGVGAWSPALAPVRQTWAWGWGLGAGGWEPGAAAREFGGHLESQSRGFCSSTLQCVNNFSQARANSLSTPVKLERAPGKSWSLFFPLGRLLEGPKKCSPQCLEPETVTAVHCIGKTETQRDKGTCHHRSADHHRVQMEGACLEAAWAYQAPAFI